jgi:hypothetical protein
MRNPLASCFALSVGLLAGACAGTRQPTGPARIAAELADAATVPASITWTTHVLPCPNGPKGVRRAGALGRRRRDPA